MEADRDIIRYNKPSGTSYSKRQRGAYTTEASSIYQQFDSNNQLDVTQTTPVQQGRIIENAFVDDSERARRESLLLSKNYFSLYGETGLNDGMFTVQQGDLVFRRIRMPGAGRHSRIPYSDWETTSAPESPSTMIFSSANGIGILCSNDGVYTPTRDEIEYLMQVDPERIYALVRSQYDFVGLAQTTNDQRPGSLEHKNRRRDIAVQTGGIDAILIGGDTGVLAGDLLIWDVKKVKETNRYRTGENPDKITFIVRAFNEECLLVSRNSLGNCLSAFAKINYASVPKYPFYSVRDNTNGADLPYPSDIARQIENIPRNDISDPKQMKALTKALSEAYMKNSPMAAAVGATIFKYYPFDSNGNYTPPSQSYEGDYFMKCLTDFCLDSLVKHQICLAMGNGNAKINDSTDFKNEYVRVMDSFFRYPNPVFMKGMHLVVSPDERVAAKFSQEESAYKDLYTNSVVRLIHALTLQHNDFARRIVGTSLTTTAPGKLANIILGNPYQV